MTSQTSKLAEFASPTRAGRVKYAPLTAGLLARKGEAVPATPYYAAEALDLYTAGPIMVSRREGVPSVHAANNQPTERAAESGAPRSRPGQAWRLRRPTLMPGRSEESVSNPFDPTPDIEPIEPKAETKLEPTLDSEPLPPAAASDLSNTAHSSEVEQASRMALSMDLDLELLARLALHARNAAQSPVRVVEEALKAYLSSAGDLCPSCSRPLSEHKS